MTGKRDVNRINKVSLMNFVPLKRNNQKMNLPYHFSIKSKGSKLNL